MATATATAGRTAQAPTRRRAFDWTPVRTYVQAAIILIWCLAPFYWMIVTGFRDTAFTFESTPYPNHITMDNFRTVFDTSLGNHFAQNLLNSLIVAGVTTIVGLLVLRKRPSRGKMNPIGGRHGSFGSRTTTRSGTSRR